MLQNLPQMRLKLLWKRAIQKTAEATGDLIGNNIADVVANSYDVKITKVSKSLPQNNSETVAKENYKQIPKESYVNREGRQKIIDELRLK